VICTANIVRSPIAATLLGARLRERGVSAVVTSAGTHDVDLGATEAAATVAAELGCPIDDHRTRVLTSEIVRVDGADLVLAIARPHLRAVVALEPAALSRTFTLKELVRRSRGEVSRHPESNLATWLGRLAAGRDLRQLLGEDPVDDVEDPYGRSLAAHRRTAHELDRFVTELVHAAPW